MKITKLPHACLIVTENGYNLVIDPSVFFEFDREFPTPESVLAVILTHNHSDHYSAKNLQKLLEKNPDMQILASSDTVATIAQDLPEVKNVTVAKPGEVQESYPAGTFRAAFFGGRHTHIVPGDDKGDNVGVVVNGQLVYPGDSFDVPPPDMLTQDVILALPTSGPWLKIGEAMVYLRDFSPTPKTVFPTHDGLNDSGTGTMINQYLEPICTEIGAKFVNLQPGQSLEI